MKNMGISADQKEKLFTIKIQKMSKTKGTAPIIKQDKQNEIPVEVLAKSIVEVADAAKKLLSSKLSKRAICVLIKDSMSGPGVTMKDIQVVLDCAANLDKRYIK